MEAHRGHAAAPAQRRTIVISPVDPHARRATRRAAAPRGRNKMLGI